MGEQGLLQWRRHGGGRQAGQLAPPPPISDRTPREIDADPRRFACRKNGVGLHFKICSHVLHAPSLRRTFFGLTNTKKEEL